MQVVCIFVRKEDISFIHSFIYSFIPFIHKKLIRLLLKSQQRVHFDIHKDIFACLFSIHNTISLSCHEQVCLSGLHFERYFPIIGPINHSCSNSLPACCKIILLRSVLILLCSGRSFGRILL